MKRTTVKIPEQMDARLRKEAELRGMTVSAVVREAIEEFLGRRSRHRRRLPFIGIADSSHKDTAKRADEILAEIYEERRLRRGRPLRGS